MLSKEAKGRKFELVFGIGSAVVIEERGVAVELE
jgi:hypothetical protein